MHQTKAEQVRALKAHGLSHIRVAETVGISKRHVIRLLRPKIPASKHCQLCGQPRPTQRHHVSYEPEIVLDLCVRCHRLQHRREFRFLNSTVQTWVFMAVRVLKGDFKNADRSMAVSLVIGLRSISHPLCQGALKRLEAGL